MSGGSCPLGAAGQRAVGPDRDPPGPVVLGTAWLCKRPREGRGLDSCGPDDCARGDPALSVLCPDVNAGGVDADHSRLGVDLDAFLFKRVRGLL